MDEGLRREARAEETGRMEEPGLAGELPKEEFHARRSHQLGEQGEVKRRYRLDVELSNGRRVIADEKRSVLVRAEPVALPAKRKLDVSESHADRSIQKREAIDG